MYLWYHLTSKAFHSTHNPWTFKAALPSLVEDSKGGRKVKKEKIEQRDANLGTVAWFSDANELINNWNFLLAYRIK